MSVRQKISNVMKCVIVILALGGTIYGLFTARLDGYSSWYKRLLYFTTQSNVWIGAIHLAIIFLTFSKKAKNTKIIDSFYLCKYFFVASIMMTGIVFCAFLGPFADESYRAWSFYSLIAHVFTPILAIVEFYVDEHKYDFKRKHLIGTLIAPFIYYAIAIFLCIVKFDFGRGDPFPYFFLDIYSELGLFGFTSNPLPNMGTFWWILLFTIMVVGLAFLLMKTHHSSRKPKKATS